MNHLCPSCQTEYSVSYKDIGRRIACARCGMHLVVDASGLRQETSTESSVNSQERQHSGISYKAISDKLDSLFKRAEWSTWFFGAGALLVIWFVMMPTIAGAYVERRTAVLAEETLDHTVYLRKLRDRNADVKQVSDAEEVWQKRRDELQESVKYAEHAKGRTAYYDRYGLLLGYLLVATGSVGWTRAEQPLTRRIIGAVVLSAQLLLAFQMLTPVGCSTTPRTYNPGVQPSP